MATYKFVVFTNAKPGREDEYNNWYTQKHVPEVLDISGFVRAQRFALEPTLSASSEWNFLVLYEIESDDASATISELMRRSKAGELVVSDAMAAERIFYVFRPISPMIEKSDKS
jgi:hypothetical protein